MHHSVAGMSSAPIHRETKPIAVILLTLSSRDRLPWLATHEVHHLLRCVWHVREAWRVGYYLLMPEHLHLFCAPAAESEPLEVWLEAWQRAFARCHQQAEWNFARRVRINRLRDDLDYGECWARVRENPVRRGLVARADDWRFQGRVRVL